MSQNELLINLEEISFRYPQGPLVLDELDFKLERGNRVGLIAPNGSGKTTLLHIIMGLLKPLSGKLEIFGKPVSEENDFAAVRGRIGLLFQDADDQLFSPTVLEDVAFGPLNLGKSKSDAIQIARHTLDSLGLVGFEDRITFKLSGGEKRLVSLATVLAMEPEVLLLDEPMNGLDIKTKATLTEILCGLDLSYVLISHDFDFLAETADSIYTMAEGKILLDSELHLHEHVHAHEHGVYPHQHMIAPSDREYRQKGSTEWVSDRRRRKQDRRQRTQDRRQGTEDKRKRSEVRGQRTEVR
ncbi:MAG: ABC transporter ATP-binding protein [Deltaproteobacteria bacterium]|jgi:cobalt/nickel transport system ATP-binding protein|nr:ABC transporter ATP-binding protein [Deltaproteobacteria bacterium]MBW2469556.1 ABC transporter ATP-binding protein [Deltaproteobacteria bacterium]MBW2486948.1 ABC transporter ATP-binding protein [Deltaproteobacteria bacterium]